MVRCIAFYAGMVRSMVRRLSTLSSFYKYCQIEDIVGRNPER